MVFLDGPGLLYIFLFKLFIWS